MNRILFFFVFGLLATLRIQGQTIAQQTILNEMSTAASQIKTLQCDFIQTKYMKMLGNKLVANGKMSCSQPDRLRWEYVSPYTYTFVLYNKKVVLKKEGRTDVFDVDQHKMFKEIAAIMMNSVLGNCFSDKNFKVELQTEVNQYVATLFPLKKEMKMMFSRIVLHYDRTQSMVGTVQLFEKNGDSTTIELKNVRKNEPINDQIYHVE